MFEVTHNGHLPQSKVAFNFFKLLYCCGKLLFVERNVVWSSIMPVLGFSVAIFLHTYLIVVILSFIKVYTNDYGYKLSFRCFITSIFSELNRVSCCERREAKLVCPILNLVHKWAQPKRILNRQTSAAHDRLDRKVRIYDSATAERQARILCHCRNI